MENNRLPDRLVNYDILRIFAAYLIIVLHLSVQYINKAPASVEDYLLWQQAIKLSALSRIGVPIFIMLSGAFLLRPDKVISLKILFRKYLPKLILIFVFWSFFYALLEQDFFDKLAVHGFSKSTELIDQTSFLNDFIQGHYHMWYLYMLAGLYLLTPLIKHITAHASKWQLLYFVTLCFVITSVIKLNDELWHLPMLDTVFDKLSVSFFFGYVGYFVAGYLISTYTPSLPVSAALLIPGFFSLKFTYEETWSLNPMFGFDSPNLVFFSNYSPTVFLMSFAVFLLTAKLGFIKVWQPLQVLIRQLPKYMLTVYLLHPFIIKLCRELSLLLPTSTAWSLLSNALIVYVLSLTVSIVIVEVYRLVLRIFRSLHNHV